MSPAIKIIIIIASSLSLPGLANDLTPEEVQSAIKGNSPAILYSLDPSNLALNLNNKKNSKSKTADAKKVTTFHRWQVLGKVDLEESHRARISKAFINAHKNTGEDDYMCFNPRHGLRIKRPGKPTLDFVICFECKKYELYVGKRKELESSSLISNDPKIVAEFNDVLAKMGVNLARPPEK